MLAHGRSVFVACVTLAVASALLVTVEVSQVPYAMQERCCWVGG